MESLFFKKPIILSISLLRKRSSLCRRNISFFFFIGKCLFINYHMKKDLIVSRFFADGDGTEVTYRYGLQDEQIYTYTAASRKQGRPAQRLTYDARGRIIGVEDGCGNRTGYQSDAWGRVTAIDTAEGGREEYAYDPAGNITRSTDARGGVIRYDYNSQGKVCAITDQQGNTETFRYDREGRRVQHTDRKGIVTETRYNIYGQPTLQTCTDSKGNRHVMGTWEYDDFGQLRKSVAGGFCYTYLYRPDGKLLKKWNSGKQVISCDYYRNGSLKSLRDVSGRTLQYTYDEVGRLSTLQDEAGSILTEYIYTQAGRIKEIRTSNGITTAYEYDGDGNISRLTIGNGTEEGLLYDAFMFYDLGGNRLSRQRYHYALTVNSNMDSVIDDEESYCYNERNELTQRRNLLSVTEYIYDENGSLIREKEREKETGYRYDLLNRQTHVYLPDGREQENLYDGEGLRAGLKESSKISTLLYYNGEILAECDGDSMPVRRHLAGVGLSQVQNLANDTFYSYHQDEQRSTAYVTGTTGEIENLYSYEGFGNILEKKEDITNRILYTGQQYDQESGQYYLRARYYNPVIGRFTQEDTYRGDGLNLYTYCGNNPVMYYDPSGHGMIDAIGAALGGCPVETNASQKNTQAEKVNSEGGSQTINPNGSPSTKKTFWQYVKEWHDKRISQIFGTEPNERRVTSDAGVRTYGVSTNGYDVEFKSDNFSNGPRSQRELAHMRSQIDKDIYNNEWGSQAILAF